MDRVIPVLALVVVLGVIVVMFMRLFRYANKADEATRWPTAEATIQSGEMEIVGKGRSAVTLPCFAFSYVVNGEYYSGRLSLSGCDDRSATLLREMIDRKLPVHYNPGKPEDFVLPEITFEGFGVRRLRD